MAEIPVEKDSNLSWLWWLLLLAGILALLWFLFARDDDDDIENVVLDDTVPAAIADPDNDGLPEVVGAEMPTITDLTMLATLTDGSMEGRKVMLTNVRAGSVPEDAGFWLDAGNDGRVWVVLEEVRTPNTPVEGRVDVDMGDMLDVTGIVRNASSTSPTGAAIPGPTAPLPDGVEHYIYASTVTQSAS